MTDIVIIPDTQVITGCPLDHLYALGNYIIEHKPSKIVHLGDHWDMPSLSVYDYGKKAAEGQRYQDDIDAGIIALEVLKEPTDIYNRNRVLSKRKRYNPEWIFIHGNHEHRINRHVEANPILEGKLSTDDFRLAELGWQEYKYRTIYETDFIYFSHYFVNPESVKRLPFSSSIDTQLKTLGFSNISGHRPGLHLASPRFTLDGRVIRGIQAGSFYMHNFEYQALPQGNKYWRGALHIKNISNGNFRLVELPIDWLIENYI